MSARKPVFFDPSRRRWTGFLALTIPSLIASAAVLVAVSASVVRGFDPVPVLLPDPLGTASLAVANMPEAFVIPDISTDPIITAAIDPALAIPEIEPDPVIVAAIDPLPIEPETEAPPLPRARPAAAPEPRAFRISPSVEVLSAPPSGAGSSIQTLPFHEPHAAPSPVIGMVLGTVSSFIVSPANAQEFVADASPGIYAFHANWDAASLSSLHENILKIDTLLPDWVNLSDGAGGVSIDRSTQTAQVMELVAQTHPGLRIVPVLSDFWEGASHPEWVSSVLANPVARMTLTDNLRHYLTGNGFSGIAIQFSGTGLIDPAGFALFMRDLQAELAPHGLALYAVLPLEDGLAHAPLIAQHTDAVIVEAWGETRMGHSPGPLASQGWFAALTAAWQAALSPEQLVFAVRNIAYDWNGSPAATPISVLEALNRARAAQADVALDTVTLNTRFTYGGPTGADHDVWMLDAVSAFNQIAAIMDTPPRGIALHRLGTEDAAVWNLLTAPATALPESMETLDYGYQIARYGSGEVIKLSHAPVAGTRTLTAEGRTITQARVTDYPRAWEIVHWGSSDTRLVALTFDDGPDPVFTSEILDILAAHDAKATFFAVGAQMLRHPEIVSRIVDEGHEIGSHTYSHTNISRMSPEMLRIDLNATQRVFESITGRTLVFFRAPYAVDANPRTPSEIAPLATVGELGYLTVNMNIDPRDWWAPDADRIASATIRGVESGLGNIVLLHDGGGDRAQTVAALPRILETLQAQGYRFVPASELIGLDPERVMPTTQRASGVLTNLEDFGLTLLRLGEQVLVVLFLAAVALGVARSLILIGLSAMRRRRPLLPAAQRDLKVGIVVPAHNEEKVILSTIKSLLTSTYANCEIIVVDDGSSDRTLKVCEKVFGNHPKIKVFTKPNGGKAEALNFGFARTNADIVVALDADTVFRPETIGWLAAHFNDPKVAAVAGNAKVGNRVNLLTRWQAVEYITAQNLDRRAFEVLNCITVVPGAVGAWRRSAVMEAGGYRTDTLAEDADLTIRLLRAGYRVAYEERAVAYTEAPESPSQLFRQRFRWMFGMLQVAFKHKDALRLRDSKSVAFVALPNILIFQILFPLIAPIADIFALMILGDLIVKLATDSALLGAGQTFTFLALFCAFMLLDLAAAVIAFIHEKREDWRLLFWLPFQRFYYRQLLYIVAIKAVLTAIHGRLVGWGNLARTAHVRLEPQK